MPTMDATATPLGDEHGFRLTEWRLPPGTSTGWHVHELPYTVVPLTDGLMRIDTPDGWIDFPIEAGTPYSRPAGVEHDVHNGGDTEIRFIEVEARLPS